MVSKQVIKIIKTWVIENLLANIERKDFIKKGIILATLLSGSIMFGFSTSNDATKKKKGRDKIDEAYIEMPVRGQPHKGKVLAAIQPHNDDIPIFTGGTVAKLLNEGYTGYLIRTSNDDATGRGSSIGERVLNNEKANELGAKVFGMEKVYDLGYRNHRMDQVNIQDLKSRLIFLLDYYK